MSDNHARQLFEQIINNICLTKKLTYDQSRVLHSLFGNVLIESLHLLDLGCVTRMDCGKEAKRQVYKVQETTERKDVSNDGKGQPMHSRLCILFPQYHCSCESFIHSVLCEQNALLCRHVLAAILYEALNDQQNSNTLDDDAFSSLLYFWDASRS